MWTEVEGTSGSREGVKHRELLLKNVHKLLKRYPMYQCEWWLQTSETALNVQKITESALSCPRQLAMSHMLGPPMRLEDVFYCDLYD